MVLKIKYLFGEFNLAFGKKVENQRPPVCYRWTMCGSRWIDAPSGVVPVETRTFCYRHDHAHLAGGMPVMRSDDIGQIDHINAQVVCFGRGFQYAAKTASFTSLVAHPSCLYCFVTGVFDTAKRLI